MKYSSVILGAILIAMLPVAPGLGWQPQAGFGNGFRISEDVRRVILPVTVLDRKGHFVTGLTKDKFEIFENGRRQEIKNFSDMDLPVSVGLIVDTSGSMRDKREETNEAALDFVRFSNPEDEVFVINFNEHVSLGLPEGEAFSSHPDELRSALASGRPQGQTALYDAVMRGLHHLKRGSRYKKALVVISDGGDNASRHSFSEVLREAQQSSAIIYTVGIFDEQDPDRNPGVLKKLARATGGQAYLPTQIEDIFRINKAIAHDLRQQYTLSYAPSNTREDGTYRHVRVVVNAPDLGKLVVRTREGYVAPGPAEASSVIPVP